MVAHLYFTLNMENTVLTITLSTVVIPIFLRMKLRL